MMGSPTRPDKELTAAYIETRNALYPEGCNQVICAPIFQNCCSAPMDARLCDLWYTTQFESDYSSTSYNFDQHKVCVYCLRNGKKSVISTFIRDHILISKLLPILEILGKLVGHQKLPEEIRNNTPIDLTTLFKFASEANGEYYILDCGHGTTREALLRALKCTRLGKLPQLIGPFEREVTCDNQKCERKSFRAFAYSPVRTVANEVDCLMPFLLSPTGWKNKLEQLTSSNLSSAATDELFLYLKYINPTHAIWDKVIVKFVSLLSTADKEDVLHFIYKVSSKGEVLLNRFNRAIVNEGIYKIAYKQIPCVKHLIALLKEAGLESNELPAQVVIKYIGGSKYDLAAEEFKDLTDEQKTPVVKFITNLIRNEICSENPQFSRIKDYFNLLPKEDQQFVVWQLICSESFHANNHLSLIKYEPLFYEIVKDQVTVLDYNTERNNYRLWFLSIAGMQDLGSLGVADYALLSHLRQRVMSLYEEFPAERTDFQWQWSAMLICTKSARPVRDTGVLGMEALPNELSMMGADNKLFEIAKALIERSEESAQSMLPVLVNRAVEASIFLRNHKGSYEPFFNFCQFIFERGLLIHLGDSVLEVLTQIIDEVDQWDKPRYYLLFLNYVEPILKALGNLPNQTLATPFIERWIQGCKRSAATFVDDKNAQTNLDKLHSYLSQHAAQSSEAVSLQAAQPLPASNIRWSPSVDELALLNDINTALEKPITLRTKIPFAEFMTHFKNMQSFTSKDAIRGCFIHLANLSKLIAFEELTLEQCLTLFHECSKFICNQRVSFFPKFSQAYANLINPIMLAAFQIVKHPGFPKNKCDQINDIVIDLVQHATAHYESSNRYLRIEFVNIWIQELVNSKSRITRFMADCAFTRWVKGDVFHDCIQDLENATALLNSKS